MVAGELIRCSPAILDGSWRRVEWVPTTTVGVYRCPLREEPLSCAEEEGADDMAGDQQVARQKAAVGSLIARCAECGVEWDIDMQPSRCCDGTHEWTLRVA